MTDKTVTIPATTAELIKRAFLPLNPNKLRKPHISPEALEELRQACRDFERAIEEAR